MLQMWVKSLQNWKERGGFWKKARFTEVGVSYLQMLYELDIFYELFLVRMSVG